MLDVHAPEHPIGNMREFLIHLFTITCGLLIALGLENAAEAIHHRHERNEAEAMIRQELRENRDAAQAGAPLVVSESKSLEAVLSFVEDRSQNGHGQPSADAKVEFTEGELQDAAWRTASSTGVLSFFDYTQVERLAAAYKEQDLLQTTLERTLDDFLQLSSVLPKSNGLNTLTAQGATEALPYLRKTVGDLRGVLAIGQGTLTAYDHALK